MPGTTAPGAPRSSTPWLRIMLILGGLGLVGMVGVAALFLVGTTVVGPGEITSEELAWQTYEDPAGRFSVELPGRPQEDVVEVPTGFGERADMESLSVSEPSFFISLGVYGDSPTIGMSFDELPFSPTGVERAAQDNGLEGAELIEHSVPDGTDGTVLEMELHGTVDGEPGVMLSHLVLVGPAMYEINVAGPLDQRDELVAMHRRSVVTLDVAHGA